MATFGAFWGQVCVFHLQTPKSDSLGLLQRLHAALSFILFYRCSTLVQRVLAMAKLSVRPSVCLSVRRVPVRIYLLGLYARHLCFSSAFLLFMCSGW